MKTLTRRQRGFTLMEVLVGMAIISVVSSIVLPGISNFYSSTRVKADAEVFVQNLRLGKYKAMQEQALHRLIFSPDGDAYKVQAHTAYDNGGFLDLNTPFADASYEDFNWESILDSDEVVIDPMVKVTRDAYLANRVVYFWPDGYLVTHNGTLSEISRISLSECYISFSYGSSLIRIYLNALGVLTSESYAIDDDGDSDADVIW